MNQNRFEMHVTVQHTDTVNGFNGEYRMTFETSENAIEAAYRHAKPEAPWVGAESRFVELIDLETNGILSFKTIDGFTFQVIETGTFGSVPSIGVDVIETGKNEYSVQLVSGLWHVTEWVNGIAGNVTKFSTRRKADNFAQHKAETSRIDLIDWTETTQSTVQEVLDIIRFALWCSDLMPNDATVYSELANVVVSISNGPKVSEFIENINANGLHVIASAGYGVQHLTIQSA